MIVKSKRRFTAAAPQTFMARTHSEKRRKTFSFRRLSRTVPSSLKFNKHIYLGQFLNRKTKKRGHNTSIGGNRHLIAFLFSCGVSNFSQKIH